MQKSMNQAFTLIELLIVVAIIGILAAIAVPNFLNAQIRAKIARNQADMRNLATALESYHVDRNQYPYPADPLGYLIQANSPNTTWFETHLSPQLTTPISYMSTLPLDPFQVKVNVDEVTTYHYMTRLYTLQTLGSDQPYKDYLDMMQFPTNNTEYILLGHGPDGVHNAPGELTPAAYEPSNGLTSSGDIIFAGPGGGFGK